MSTLWESVLFGAVVLLLFMFGVFLVYKEEILDWVKSRFTKKRKEVNFENWSGAEVRIGLDFAANGVVIRSYSEGRHSGALMCIQHTRVAHDASEIGNEVMALLSEIQLGK